MLTQIKDQLKGKIYLCFQVAEEVGGGAGEIVEYLKQKGGVDGVIGTHLDGGSDAGVDVYKRQRLCCPQWRSSEQSPRRRRKRRRQGESRCQT